MPDLETVDVPGVEILSAGGPVHGVGSPPEGDFWTKTDLEAIAAANRELAGELQAPSKIGHSAAQLLLNNSGMAVPTPGEMPAVGWLDGASFRVEERDGVAKLFADVKAVPKKFADLLAVKAYSTRSVELSRVESQEIKDDKGAAKVYDWVVTGLAWLGAKLPAVRTLDEITAWYESEDLAAPHAKVFVVYAAGDVVWDPEAGFQDLRDDVSEALNGVPTGGMNEPRFWVADIAITLDKALVQDYYDDGDDGYVVPFTRNADDSITISPSSDWTEVEKGWVEAARENAERSVSLLRTRADIRPVVSEKTYTEEQKRTFAEATGLELDKVTDEVLAAAGVAVIEEPKVDPAKELEADERFRKLEADTKAANDRAETLEKKLEQKDRDTLVDSWLRDGKAEPGRKDEIVAMYDEAPVATRKFFEAAPVNDQWAREYGTDSEELTDEELEADEKAYEAEARARGIEVTI